MERKKKEEVSRFKDYIKQYKIIIAKKKYDKDTISIRFILRRR